MTDRIHLTGLAVQACHGVLDFEKTIPQPFIIDLALEVDLRPAGESDDLGASLSYAEVAQRVVEVCSGEPVDLIETLAERIATACLEWDVVEAVDVRVHKPQAPAGVAFTPSVNPLAGPGVSLRRERDREAVIALGTNIGRRVATLRAAVEMLRQVEGLDVVTLSPLVETDPVGGVDQPDFLNAVLIGRTRLAGPHLMRELHRIEKYFGRTRDVRWGPRTLDLDLIQLGTPGEPDEVRCGGQRAAAAVNPSDELALPHPRAHERAFVVAPWAEAAPWMTLRTPDGTVNVAERAKHLGAAGVRPGPRWDDDEPFAGGESA